LLNIEGVIFDIDGTLCKTNQLIFESFRHINKKYSGRNLTDTEIISYFGPTETEIISKLFPDKIQEVENDYFDFYKENHNNLAELHEGIEEILKLLQLNKIHLGIYTGKGRRSSEITLTETGIIDYFDLIVTGDDLKGSKPDCEGARLFLEKFELHPKNVMMVGDAITDILVARNCGLIGISVTWDSYDKNRVIEYGNNYLFENTSDLLNFFKTNINHRDQADR